MDSEDEPKLELTQPRSMVSLDHNGPSVRVVCFGGKNIISVDPLFRSLGKLPLGTVDGKPAHLNVHYQYYPALGWFMLLFALGLAIGVWADVLLSFLPLPR